jgi:dTDP-glucose 4,6-dehydratase
MSVLQLAERIIAVTGSASAIEFVPRPVDDPAVRRPDTTLARTALGWQAHVPWEAGLRRTVAWFADELAARTA